MILNDLLQEKNLRDLIVINEKADLTRVVSTVESTETPDVAAYVPPNTLLLTTAMAYQNCPKDLCQLVRDLDCLPCAGMAIKIGRFVDELDPEVIEVADELGFPLIQIPMYQTLGEVYHHMLACIWDNENEDLLYALNIQKRFYNLVLQNASLNKLMSNLGLVLKQPIFIVDLFGNIHGASNATKAEEKAVEALSQRMVNTQIEWSELADSRDNMVDGQRFRVYPIQVASHPTHYLMILEKDKKMTPMSNFVLEQVLLIFGMYFYKQFHLYYNEIQQREQFLDRLVEHGEREQNEIQKLLLEGRSLGLKLYPYYQVVIARVMEMRGRKFNTPKFMKREEQYILIYEWLKKSLEECYHKEILVLPNTAKWGYVFLIQGRRIELVEKMQQLYNHLSQAMNLHLEFSCGNEVYEMEMLPGSYWKARASFHNGEIKNGIAYIHHYRPQNILELLKSISDNQIHDVCVQILRSLAYPQDEMTIELRKTLKTYLECHCSIIETANLLYVHRNTIRYRIKRCEEILDNDLKDSDYCFQLQLCLFFTDKFGEFDLKEFSEK